METTIFQKLTLNVFSKALLSIIFLILSHVSYSASFASIQSGNWNDPFTWHAAGTAGTPTAGDIVTLSTGHQVTVTTNAFCHRLIVNGSSRSIMLQAGVKLTMTGLISLSSSADLNWCQGSGTFRFVGNSDRGNPPTASSSNSLIVSSGTGYTRWDSAINIELELDNATDSVNINSSTFICSSIHVKKGILRFGPASAACDVYFNTASNGVGGFVNIEADGTIYARSIGRRVSGSASQISSSFIETLTVQGKLVLVGAGSGNDHGFAGKNVTINGRFVIANTSGSAVVSSPSDAIVWGTNSILEYQSNTTGAFQNFGAELSRNGGTVPTIGSIVINVQGSNTTEIRTFSRSVNIRNELKFLRGKIQFGASTEKITLLSTAHITGADSTKFIYYSGTTSSANKGLVKLGITAGQTFEFPVGLFNGTDYFYTPILITNHSGAALDYEVSIALFNLQTRVSGSAGTDFMELPGYQGRLNAEWNMGKVGGGASNVDIQIRYRNLTTTGTFVHSNAQLVHYTGPNWDTPLATTYNPTSSQFLRSIKVLNYTGPFSPFGIGDFQAGMTPLPVELILFEAKELGSHVDVVWKTGSERSNDFFTIEKSQDGLNWGIVAYVAGAGNSAHELSYHIIDENPTIGTSYYRLKQTDFDGTETIFEELAYVYFQADAENVTLYPNPCKNVLSIHGKLTVQDVWYITDATGKVVMKQGNNDVNQTIDVSQLGSGAYIFTVYNQQRKQQTSFIKLD